MSGVAEGEQGCRPRRAGVRLPPKLGILHINIRIVFFYFVYFKYCQIVLFMYINNIRDEAHVRR